FRFPFKNPKIIKYWIAATGRNNWFPASNVRICSLHFTDNDYYDINNKRTLKPNVIPTWHVHPNILAVFQESTMNKINECKYIIKL
ncbi:THAP domain-containing protein 3, partial [Trachymyrmex zeteki]